MADKTSYTCAILTISDKGSRGERKDTSGPQLQQQLAENKFSVTSHEIVPDNKDAIQAAIKQWVDNDNIDLIVSTGGTGVSPTDVTPEATLPILDKEIPGISEAAYVVQIPRLSYLGTGPGVVLP
jgi:molybdenum cofactor synthesis domain-containing protein